ncbi:MAG: ABC transporter ATP-binding protein [Firmicutes bacterium]|nr:ABC transporter ATP-binding protein [Bacillota bacterium]
MRHPEEVVRVSNLTVRYPGNAAPALSNVDLTLETGECVIVSGPSGCGKSTLALCLTGFIPHAIDAAMTGSVRVGGLDPRQVGVYNLAEFVGLVQQDPEAQFCTMRVEDEVAFGPENLLCPADEIARRVDWALDAVSSSHLRMRRLAELSGGEKQRVALAAVLAMRPSVLILDEPTAHLDPRATGALVHLLGEMQSQLGLAIMVLEHRPERFFGIAHRVVQLSDGTVVFNGPPREALGRADGADALTPRARAGPRPGTETITGIEPGHGSCPHLGPPDHGSPDPGSLRSLPGPGLHAWSRPDPDWRPGGPEFRPGPDHNFARPPGHDLPPSALSDDLRSSSHSGSGPGAGRSARPFAKLACGSGKGCARDYTLDNPLLRVCDLTQRYPDRAVLQEVSLVVGRGEIVGIMGDNGSGKTTLLLSIMGVLRPASGRIILDGDDITNVPVSARARRIGMIFQNPNHQLFTDHVWREVVVGPLSQGVPEAVCRPAAEALLDRFDLVAFRDSHPLTLSYGQKRRVNLAAVMVSDPSVLLLDEPFVGQDAARAQDLARLLGELASAGKGILLVGHEPDLMSRCCDRLLFLDGGRVIVDAPVCEALADFERMGLHDYLPQAWA